MISSDRQLILQEFRKQKFDIPEHFIDDRIATITREEFGGDQLGLHSHPRGARLHARKIKQMETEKMVVLQAIHRRNDLGRRRCAGKRDRGLYGARRGKCAERGSDQVAHDSNPQSARRRMMDGAR